MYRSFNISGNLHHLREYLDKHEPTADVVAVDAGGGSMAVLVKDHHERDAITRERDGSWTFVDEHGHVWKLRATGYHDVPLHISIKQRAPLREAEE
jgi:hypothetical protein